MKGKMHAGTKEKGKPPMPSKAKEAMMPQKVNMSAKKGK